MSTGIVSECTERRVEKWGESGKLSLLVYVVLVRGTECCLSPGYTRERATTVLGYLCPGCGGSLEIEHSCSLHSNLVEVFCRGSSELKMGSNHETVPDQLKNGELEKGGRLSDESRNAKPAAGGVAGALWPRE